MRSATSEGPQFVTKHGDEVAVVLDIREYRRLKGGTQDFKAFLRSAPDFDELELERSRVPAPVVELESSYLLDTNVVSEVRRRRPDAGVMAWFDSVRADELYLSVIVVGEISARHRTSGSA